MVNGTPGLNGLHVLLHVENLVEELGKGHAKEDNVMEMIMKKMFVTLFHVPLGHHDQDVQLHVCKTQY